MFWRKQTCSKDRLNAVRANKPETSLRVHSFVFPFVFASLLTLLSALTAPGYAATTSSSMDAGALASSDSNGPTEAAGTIPPDSESRLDAAGAGNDSTAKERDPSPAIIESHSSAGANVSPSGVLTNEQKAGESPLSAKCLLLRETLCRAVKNRPVALLATMQTAALISDGVTTRQYLQRGYSEVDPVARILIGSKPTWARMAPLGAVQVVAGMWLAERMATSRHVWLRRFWWLPQAMGIAGNAAASVHNLALR